MRKEIVLAAILSAVCHVGFLVSGGLDGSSVAENVTKVDDVDLIQKEKEPPPPPAKGDDEEEKQDNNDLILPDELIASGLNERIASTVALDAMTIRVKPINPPPPRPDSMEIGIPSGARVGGKKAISSSLVFDVTQLDREPRPRFKVAPRYPVEMRMNHVEGRVDVLIVVDTSGRVIDATIKSSTNSTFEQPALEAIRKWRFEPGMKDGTPVSFHMVQPLLFSVKN